MDPHAGESFMPQTQYAFVVKAPGYAAPTHSAVIESPAFRTRIVGDDALAVVGDLVADVRAVCRGVTRILVDDKRRTHRHHQQNERRRHEKGEAEHDNVA
jgi:hypothetical protein